jgi:Na+-driven multidrug efflux pump
MKDLTQGSITRNILEMAAPMAAGMIFQTLYLMVGLYFVAALGGCLRRRGRRRGDHIFHRHGPEPGAGREFGRADFTGGRV